MLLLRCRMCAVGPEVSYGLDEGPLLLFIVILWGRPRVQVLLKEQTPGNGSVLGGAPGGHPRCTTPPPKGPPPLLSWWHQHTYRDTDNTPRYADMLLWLLLGAVAFTGNSVIVFSGLLQGRAQCVSGDFEVPIGTTELFMDPLLCCWWATMFVVVF